MSAPRPAGRFPAAQRIRNRSEFQRIQREGRRVTTPFCFFVLHAAATNGPRLGVTASRRVGGAVVRNRAKRLVREAFRATRELWGPGLAVLVIVRRAPTGLTLRAVVEQWQEAAPALRRRAREALADRESALA